MRQKITILTSICFLSIFSGFGQSYLKDSSFLNTTDSGLKYQITNKGNGKYPKSGDRVWVDFVGKLINDSVFDQTTESGARDFYLGQGQLIKAWEEGILLMDEGAAMVMVVPPELAYGNQKYMGIKPNSTIVFEMVLVQVDQGQQIEPFDISGVKAKKTKDKIVYYTIQKGEGENAIVGDNAFVHYTGFLDDGTIFDSSHKKGKPVRITVGGDHVFKGWDLAIQSMNVGSKTRFVIPANLAYGEKGFKQIIPPNETLIMDLELVNIKPEIKVSQWDASDLDTLSTESGLRYIVFNEGEGDLIVDDNVVEVHYSGYFSDGELFDSSVKRDEPIRFPIGAGFVIDGWDEGLKLMKKGSRVQLLVPSKLAYGEQGAPPQIKSNSDLVFDIEVLDVSK